MGERIKMRAEQQGTSFRAMVEAEGPGTVRAVAALVGFVVVAIVVGWVLVLSP